MTLSVADIYFGVVDYTVFSAVLVISLGIGIYYSFFNKNQSVEDYLIGGRKLLTLPIAMSLLATLMSPILVVGFPTEFYIFGIHMTYLIFSIFFVGLQFQFLYMKIFHDQKITTVYEYLNMRFGNSIRVVCGTFFCISMVLWMPMMVFVTSIAFSQVTGQSTIITTTVLTIVCTLYTCKGGLKAVVWTDVIQVVVIVITLLTFVVRGTIKLGGFAVIWQKGVDGERIEPPRWSLDLTERITFINTFVNGIIAMTAFNLHQPFIQRYLSLPTLGHANRALWIFQFGYVGYVLLASYCGLMTYALFYDCDPLTTKIIKKPDQILLLTVMHILGDIPGLSGLFIAGICSATLSSLSSALNSLAAVVLKDFVIGFCNRNPNTRQSSIILNVVVIISGLSCLALSIIIENFDFTLLQLGFLLQNIQNGPMLGVFTCAALLPWVTTKGAICGAFSGVVFVSWISIGAQVALSSGDFKYPTKPLGNVDGCTYNFTSTFHNETIAVLADEKYVLPLYRVSFLWFGLFGWLITVAVALIVSFATGYRDPATVDKKLLSPVIRRWFENSKYSKYEPVKLQTVNEE